MTCERTDAVWHGLDPYEHIRHYMRLYIVDGRAIREVKTVGEWVWWMASVALDPSLRVVGDDTIGDARVHTNFWGVQHIPASSDLWDGHLFETGILRAGDPIEVVGRCSTWEEAEQLHAHTVARLRGEHDE